MVAITAAAERISVACRRSRAALREFDGKQHAARLRGIVRALANFAAHNTPVDYGCAINGLQNLGGSLGRLLPAEFECSELRRIAGKGGPRPPLAEVAR
jgi:hypothetical protein